MKSFSLFLFFIIINLFSSDPKMIRLIISGSRYIIEDRETRKRLGSGPLSSLNTGTLPNLSLQVLYDLGTSMTQEEWDKLPLFCKPFYIYGDDGNYHLMIGGLISKSIFSPEEAAQEQMKREELTKQLEGKQTTGFSAVFSNFCMCQSPVHVEDSKLLF